MSRACERCGEALDGRRPEARYCSAACRRAAARERLWARAPAPAGPGERPCEATDCRVHACETALRRLGERLDELARGLPSADGRLMARVMRDALVGREGK